MKLIIDVIPDDKDRVDRLVMQGRYRTSEQFIQVSIRNQLSLEEDGSAAALPERVAPLQVVPIVRSAPGLLPAVLQWSSGQAGPRETAGPEPVAPDLLPHFATKLWPCKLVVRFLAHQMVVSGQSGFAHTDLLTPLQQAAVDTRLFLEKMHRDTPRVRGTFLHAGLPDQDAKSIKRFHDLYFIGRPGAPGPSQSLAVRLGLLAVQNDASGTSTVRLTATGVKFAEMTNPVLDSDNPAAVTSPFSNDEAAFLVQTIAERAAKDLDLMQRLAGLLGKKPRTRDEILKAMKAAIVAAGSKTDAMVNGTFVSLTSRLIELGAAELVKDGVRTSYTVGPRSDLFGGGT